MKKVIVPILVIGATAAAVAFVVAAYKQYKDLASSFPTQEDFEEGMTEDFNLFEGEDTDEDACEA